MWQLQKRRKTRLKFNLVKFNLFVILAQARIQSIETLNECKLNALNLALPGYQPSLV